MKLFLLFSFFFIVNSDFGQRISTTVLSKELQEVSGLEIIGDTLLIGHNDGGNEATLFFMNTLGEIKRKCKISNAKNTDWEDITKDSYGNLYIADIGNNANKRKKVRILKVSLDSALNNDSVSAYVFPFNYPDQQTFPPPFTDWHYDAESIAFMNDSLWIFTKCRTKPFDGKSFIYAIHYNDLGKKEWTKKGEFVVGKRSWKKDSFTGGTSQGNKFFLITYNRLITIQRNGNQFVFISKKKFLRYIQRESIAISDNGKIFIANERHWLLGKQRLNNYRHE